MKLLIQAFACLCAVLWCPAAELQQAAGQGDAEKVRVLLEAAPSSINVRDGGTTALHEAARAGHLKVVELLVSKGADVNATDFSGLTPLKLALGYRRAEIVGFLKQNGGLEQIPVRLSPTIGKPPADRGLLAVATNSVATNRTATVPATLSTPTNPPSLAAEPSQEPAPTNRPVPIERVMQVIYPIHEAARLGDLEQIKFLFKTTPDLIDSTDEKKLTALHFAAANRQLAAARMLLGFRATVDPLSNSGQTPLHLAAKNGDLAIAQLLLTNRADVNARDNFANTPLIFAAQAGENEELQAAIVAGERYGRDVSQKRATVATLHRQQLDLIQLLLSHRADVSARNRSGATALLQAVRLGNQAVVQTLLGARADPNIEDSTTRSTPLHLAAGRGQTSIAEALIQHKASINALDSRGDTPLSYALREGHQATIVALRRAGGNVGQTRALTAAEQSLIEFYQKSEAILQNGSASAKSSALLSMNPTKRDLEKMFPGHSASAWKVVEELNRQIKEAFRKPVNDADRGKEIWRIRPEPPSLLAQEWLNRRWLALPVISLAVDKTGSTSRPGDYCHVNDHWVLVPPLQSIEAMQISTAARTRP